MLNKFIRVFLATAMLWQCCSPGAFCAESNAPVQLNAKTGPVFNEGLALYKEGKWEEAAAKLEQVCKEVPGFEPAYQCLGVCLINQRKWQKALAACQRASALKPDHSTTLFNLAVVYENLNNLEDSYKTYQRFLELHPSHPQAADVRKRIPAMKLELDRRASVPNSKGKDNYLEEAAQLGAYRWKSSSMPVTVFVDPAAGVDRYQAEFGNILRESFNDWCGGSEGLVSVKFVPDANDAQIKCTWTGNTKDLVDPREGGETLCKSAGHDIAGASMLLLIPEKSDNAKESQSEALRRVCLHEVGHALGIAGHSSQSGDIMFYSSGSTTSKLSDRDKKTLAELYKAPDSFMAAHPLSKGEMGVAGFDSNPKNRALRLTNQGIEYHNAGSDAKALECFEEAQKLMPDEQSAASNLASAYNSLAIKESNENNQAAAEAHWKQAMEFFVRGNRWAGAAVVSGNLAGMARNQKREADAQKYEQMQREYEGKK